MNQNQGKIWFERALFYGQKGDQINAERAYAIALRYDPHLPPLPRFYNHTLLRTLERACLFATLLILCWLIHLLFFSDIAITRPNFHWWTSIQKVTATEEFEPEKPTPTSALAKSQITELDYDTLESYTLLRNALFCFARDQGHFPEDLTDLIKAKYIDTIPVEPETNSAKIYSQFTNEGGWVYLYPSIYAPHKLKEQVEMALYINRKEAPLTPFIPRSLTINIVEPSLTLKEGNHPLKTWPISMGAVKTPTPSGSYLIINKHILNNSSTNPYGSRWMKLGEQYPYTITGSSQKADQTATRGIGIHGTNDPTSIGLFVTNGCIRMQNSDIEELYQLVPNGITINIETSSF